MASSKWERDGRKVLCVGNSCIDFINIVHDFPEEDSDQQGLDYYWQRGGNASNSCTVLSLASVPCEFMGVLGDQGAEASWILEDYMANSINTDHCVVKSCLTPVATSILCLKSGSRTILFYPRNRPQLTSREFGEQFKGDFNSYSWVHLEVGTNVNECVSMMESLAEYNRKLAQEASVRSKLIVSAEIEKPGTENSETIMSLADVVFLSKDFAKFKSFTSPETAVREMYKFCRKGCLLICAWGDRGAAACLDDIVVQAPALTDIKVVDSLGAGDTFVSGFICYSLKRGFAHCDDTDRLSLVQKALSFACRLAGQKCTKFGFQHLKEFLQENEFSRFGDLVGE